jgi:L-malate glycosyltransferase
VPLFLRSLDAFVLASKFEPFGVALLEAKAAALPIVATRVNEVPEIVGEAHGGLLVPKEDPQAMADAFVRLAREPALRRRFGRQARADAEQRFSLRAMLRTYEGLYDLARGPAAGAGSGSGRTLELLRQALTFSPGA